MSHMIFASVGDEAAFAIMAKQRAQAASGRKVPTINDYNSALRKCIAEKASDWQAACKSAEEASKEIGRLKAEIERLRLTDAEREAIGVAIQCVEAAMAQRHPEEEDARDLLHKTSTTLSRLFDRCAIGHQ